MSTWTRSGLATIALGGLLGYLAASVNLASRLPAQGATADERPAAGESAAPTGSPSATTTISGKQLPAPDPKFGGVIEDSALKSKPWWAPRIVPRKSAPNVLLIMTDDVGYGAPSTFGGVIPTPAMDRIAKAGLRYTCFQPSAPRHARP
jgi:arylsulfatase